MKKSDKSNNIIADNRRASHDYELEDSFEAGMILEGWEVKSLRAFRGQIAESHVIIKDGEVLLIGANISPLATVSTHITADPQRTRKLLLHQREINKLIGAVQRKGYTIVPLNMHWKHGRAKISIALAKGKKIYDKRQSDKEKDWKRQKQILSKQQM